jgi:hypothetical protein
MTTRESELSVEVLTARLYELRKEERALLVEFLVLLGELDRRQALVGLGFPSVFEFLVRHLGCSNGSAFRRMHGAKLVARFPVVADYLRDGRIGLTALVELRDVLSDENHVQLLDRAAGRNVDDVRVLVATLAPKPAPKESFRRVPTKLARATSIVEVTPAPPPPAPAQLAPISDDLRVLRITVGQAFADKLARLRSLTSHTMPGASIEQLLAFALEQTVDTLETRRHGAGQPQRKASDPTTRYVPAAVRHEVFRRDGNRCTFTGPTGHRCNSTHQLELHHIIPFSLGGSPRRRERDVHRPRRAPRRRTAAAACRPAAALPRRPDPRGDPRGAGRGARTGAGVDQNRKVSDDYDALLSCASVFSMRAFWFASFTSESAFV